MTLVRRMVAPMFVPAILHISTPITPIIHIVGCICPCEALDNQWANTSIQPWWSKASIRINWEKAKGINANGSLGRAVKKVGKCAAR